jgi:hypothetical protein
LNSAHEFTVVKEQLKYQLCYFTDFDVQKTVSMSRAHLGEIKIHKTFTAVTALVVVFAEDGLYNECLVFY